jgi:opacity protein-like surface antigen
MVGFHHREGTLRMKKLSIGILYILAACGISATAAAQSPSAIYNPAGFYIGGSVGVSDLHDNNDEYGFDNGYGYYRHHTAWKAMLGIRPIPMLGAELSYMDFGGDRGDYSSNYYYGAPYSQAKAGAAFAVGYLPIPLPFFDVYGKAGVARLHEIDYFDIQNLPCNAIPGCFTATSANRWSTDFAYGGGVQWHIGGLGLRAEYERIDTSGPNPDMFTFGVTWTF